MLEQAFFRDLYDQATLFPRITIPERVLLARLNACLANEAPHLACSIEALRPYHSQFRNWEVAKFNLADSAVADVDTRIRLVARILARAGLGIDVDWPTVALH